ncbi:MAG: DUF881 domain-containing protein [Clostridia bacterium]|nr:DUF881 domain-containing protein [Clostridia bacterium]
MKHYKWQIPITIVCLIFGVLFAIQLQFQSTKPVSNLRNQDLVNLIKELEISSFSLEDEIDNLRLEITSFQEEQASGEIALRQLQRDLSSLRDLTGLTEQKGPGVFFTIDDNRAGADAAKAASLENFRPDDYIVHYKNVLYLVNELRQVAGAVSVNNQRIVASTDIRCVGTVILINTTRLAPPYEIRAIGDSELLFQTITGSYEYAYLQSLGFPIKVTKEQELTVPAFRGSYRYNFAQAIVEEGDN